MVCADQLSNVMFFEYGIELGTDTSLPIYTCAML